MEILMISTARNILNPESRDRERMRLYANKVGELHIVVFSQMNHGTEEEIHEGNLHIYPTASKNRPLMLVDAFRVGKRIAGTHSDNKLVVTAQDPLWTGWLAFFLARKKHTRLHIQLHGDYFGEGWSKGSVRRKIALRMILFLLHRAPKIRVVSERIQHSLTTRGINARKITVLPIRPELERFLLRTHSPKTEPPYTLLFVGRFAPEKNIDRILRAFVKLNEKRNDVRLKLVGKGELQSEYESFIRKHELEEVVTFEDWTEDVPDVMANADVFVLASKHEAYGLVLLEAMAVGLPIVTTDVGCVGEVMKDKEHGVVVKDGSVDAYAEAIESLLNNPDAMRLYGLNAKKTAQAIAARSMDEYVEEWVNSMPQ